MDIIVDFDGTVVSNEFPEIGKDIGAVGVLRELVENGHNIILSTMRSDVDNPQSTDIRIIPKGGKYLTEAIKWFKDNKIPLYGVQSHPTQHLWTHSPKAYGDLLIDDTALGCPKKYDLSVSEKPFVDWDVVRTILCQEYGLVGMKK